MGKLNYNELVEHRKKFLSLEKRWEEAQGKLLRLPAKLGFDSTNDLIAALRNASAARRPASLNEAQRVRRKRQSLTPEIKSKVKKLVAAGKTSAYIAEKVNISVPSVHNIKKQFGLVKTRTPAS